MDLKWNVPKLSPKQLTILAAAAAATGITLGVAIGYILYRRRRSKPKDDSDEGIGDVDSIVSEGELGRKAAKTGSDSSVSTPFSSATALHTESVESMEMKESPIRDQLLTEISDSSFSTPHGSSTGFNAEQRSAENSHHEPLKPMKVLVLGLEGCGKSSLLNMLSSQPEITEHTPTKGFNVLQIERNGIDLSIMEVGGSDDTRAYWKNFTNETSLLVYVVDASIPSKFDEAKLGLLKLLDESTLKNVSCLIIANKQDKTGAVKAEEICREDDLKELKKKSVTVIKLLNSVSIARKDGSSDRDVIMDVIVELLNQK